MITLDQIPKIASAVASQVMDGEAVLTHPMLGKIKVVNHVGAFIWESLNGRRTAAEIAALVTSKYEVPAETAEQDVLRFLESLLAREFIIICEGP